MSSQAVQPPTLSEPYIRPVRAAGAGYFARVVAVLVRMDLKLQYSDSALSYLWSLLKPLAIFSVLYVVFGRLLRLGTQFEHFPLYLLIGIVLWSFFTAATNAAVTSIVARGPLLRRMAFPALIVPVSASLTAGVAFVLSAVAIAALVAWNGIAPRPDWLLVLPLLGELYVFTLAVSLLLSALYVRFRDVAQLWEVAAQLLFYVSPIIYPLELLPPWAQRLTFLNPFAQTMQDIRALILYTDRGHVVTAGDVFAAGPGRLLPLTIAALCLLLALVLFKREEPWFAERS